MTPFILLIIVILIIVYLDKKRYSFPGPKRLPIIGSIPWLSIKKGLFDWVLSPEITKHKVAFVQLGPMINLYILNDYEVVKELFSKDVFSRRSPEEFQNLHRFVEKDRPAGIILTNGDNWTTQRRFALKTLRDFGFGKACLEDTMNAEIDELIEHYTSTRGDQKIGTDFNVPIINILWQVVAGVRITPEDPVAYRMVDLVNENFKIGPGFMTVLPFWIVKRIPRHTGYQQKSGILEEHKAFLLRTIEEHEQTYDPGHMRDFIDVYLTQIRGDTEGKYTRNDLCTTLMDFFHAGTETSSTTLKWTLLYLVLHQEYQEKCRQEIKKVLGDSRPELKHIPELPFTMATLSEIQRLARVAPMSLPHEAAETFTWQGFTFPEGGVLHANLSFIMRDPKHFPDPDTFNPNRFIDQHGNFNKNERVIPFGIGKRFCMGELLARNEIFLFAANLVQRLRFLPADLHPPPSAEQYSINLTAMPDDFYVRIEPVNSCY